MIILWGQKKQTPCGDSYNKLYLLINPVCFCADWNGLTKVVGHGNMIPRMQFWTGIPRNTQCIWEFKNNALWDTQFPIYTSLSICLRYWYYFFAQIILTAALGLAGAKQQKKSLVWHQSYKSGYIVVQCGCCNHIELLFQPTVYYNLYSHVHATDKQAILSQRSLICKAWHHKILQCPIQTECIT